jgi:hypothetical protein
MISGFEALNLRSLLLAWPVAGLLAGCAGKDVEHPAPTSGLLGPELARFGLSSDQSQCLLAQLQTNLSERRLRQLARAAGAVRQASTSSAQLNPRELLGSARLVKDQTVSRELGRAADACGLFNMSVASGPVTAPPPGAGAASPGAGPRSSPPRRSRPSTAPASAPTVGPVWLSLGAAPTGQAIAVDAYSILNAPAYRQAWFRVNNPAMPAQSSTSYLLRIDCEARTINPMALRKGAGAAAAPEQRDYGPAGEGALPVESGTVMEIAYLALCTDI